MILFIACFINVVIDMQCYLFLIACKRPICLCISYISRIQNSLIFFFQNGVIKSSELQTNQVKSHLWVLQHNFCSNVILYCFFHHLYLTLVRTTHRKQSELLNLKVNKALTNRFCCLIQHYFSSTFIFDFSFWTTRASKYRTVC